jgi:hypothetical protein
MEGATIITTVPADWARHRPAGWRIRRLERNNHSTYLMWDPTKVRAVVVFVTRPSSVVSKALERAGFIRLPDEQLTHKEVWMNPSAASAQPAA